MFMVPEPLVAVIVGLMIAVPLVLIYKKAGLHPGWAALVFLPVFGVLLVFLQLAFQAWPNAKNER
jgi:hypothetical protein